MYFPQVADTTSDSLLQKGMPGLQKSMVDSITCGTQHSAISLYTTMKQEEEEVILQPTDAIIIEYVNNHNVVNCVVKKTI